MEKKKSDVEVKEVIRDLLLTKNDYKLVDKYVLRDGKKHPFAILVPGGGYNLVCSCIEGVPIAKRLNSLGYSAFILYYHVKKAARFPAPQDDLARAVKEIFASAKEYDLDTENYSIWGASAGGHLVGSFGADSMGYPKYGLPKPGALVLSYPVISMEKELTHMDSHDALLGKTATYAQELAASVDLQVTPNYPPTYIWCGDADKTVSPENTRRMAAALEKVGVSFQCEVFPGVDHGVGTGLGTAADGWIHHAVEFWQNR